MPSPGAPESRLVLVVDDDADFCIAMRHLLGASGFRVILASDGLDALNVLKRYDVSIILTDLFMPRMDGIELIRHVRKGRVPMPAIIATTGNAHLAAEATAIAAAMLGAQAALLKPFTREDLLSVIDALSEGGGLVPTGS